MDSTAEAPGASPVKRRTLVETVTEEISQIILNGELRPGDKLREAEIAERLGVSRGPVREASRRLQETGLLTGHPFRGSFVRKLNQREVADIYTLRAVLECTAAEEAVRVIEASDFAGIEAALRETETAALANAPGRMIEADVAFHAALCRSGHNERITDTFTRLATELRLVHLMMHPDPEQLQAAARGHAAILEAFRARSTERLLAVLKAHILDERDIVLQYLGPHGDSLPKSAALDPKGGAAASKFAGKVMVRQHVRSDFPLLARMNRELADDEGHRNPMTIEQMEARFGRFVDEEGWSVDLFMLDDEVVGYATHRREAEPSDPSGERVFLRQFYIVRHYRRDGLGQAAFDKLVAARFRPGDRVILEAIENNPGGRVFWLRVGFTPYSSILEHFVKSPRE